MSIPEWVNVIANTGEIAPIVADLSKEYAWIETEPYVISFENYNEDHCGMQDAEKSCFKKAMQILKKIGTKVCCKVDFQKVGYSGTRVDYDGEYKEIYNWLPDGVEVRELDIGSSARLFFYDIESCKKFYLVALKNVHFETGKRRQ